MFLVREAAKNVARPIKVGGVKAGPLRKKESEKKCSH